MGAHAVQVKVALLSIDITGFTALASFWARHGVEGTERITAVLDRYFARVVGVIEYHGGEAVYFAGDGIMAWWPLRDDPTAEQRATACAHELQAALAGYLVGETALHIKIGVAAGQAWLSRLGGVQGRWLLALTGPAVARVVAAEAACRPDEVRMASSHTGEVVALTPPNRTTRKSRPLPALTPVPPLAPALERTVAMDDYLPRVVRERWRHDQAEWLADLRILTVVFIRLDGVPHEAFAQLQTAMSQIQRITNRFDGTVDKFLFDAKGPTVIAFFGLPPNASDDVANRGTRAAHTIAASLNGMGIGCGIGVATGRAYCGPLGPSQRREYAVIGPTVNLAARLMEACDNGVLVCDTTRSAAGHRLVCSASLPLELKGFPGITLAWQPLAVDSEAATEHVLVGRERERYMLSAALRRALMHRVGCLALLGDAGAGKSALGRQVRAEALALGMEVWDVTGDPLEQFSSMHAWRRVAMRVLGLAAVPADNLVNAATATSVAAERVGAFAPLLAELLGLPPHDTPLTCHLIGSARADRTNEVVSDWLADRIGAAPALLLLEDWQWVDSASRRLAASLYHKLPAALMVVMARHLSDDDALRPYADRFELAPLGPKPATELLCARTAATSVAPELVATLLERTAGNPQFLEQLTEMLVANRSLVVTAGVLHLAPGAAGQLSAIPTTIEGIVAARVDALDPDGQLTLKAASAVGREFSLALLRAALPSDEARIRLPAAVASLHNRGLIAPTSANDTEDWRFVQAIVQEVVHARLVTGQRKALHRSISSWYLKAEPMVAPAAVLARHLSLAGELEQAQGYAELACSQAMALGAFVEARAHGHMSLDLCDKLHEQGDAQAAARRVRTLRMLAEVAASLGDLRQSSQLAVDSLAQAGHMPLAGTLRWFDAALQFVVVLSGLSALRRRRAERDRARGLDVARNWQVLAKAHFFENNEPGMVQACLRFCAEAERTGASAELASAWVAMSTLLAVLPLPSLARRYQRRAVELADALGDPNTSTWVSLVAGLNAVARGEWPAVAEHTASVQQHTAATHDWGSWGSAQALGTWAHFYQGDDASVRERAQALRDRAVATHNTQQVGWADRFLGEQAVLQGEPVRAVALLEPTVARLRTDNDTAELLVALGDLALAYAAQGATDQLAQLVAESIHILSDMGRPTSHVVAHACVCLALAVEQAQQAAPPLPWLKPAASSLLAFLDRCAAGYAPAVPWCAWAHAVRAVRQRQPGKALRWLARGLRSAEQLGMPRPRQLLWALRLDPMLNTGAGVGLSLAELAELRALTVRLGPWLDSARLLPVVEVARVAA